MEYTWIIESVSQLDSKIRSPEIALFIPSKVSFYLYYYPSGFSREEWPDDPFIALCCEETYERDELNFRYRVSLINKDGEKCFTHGWY